MCSKSSAFPTNNKSAADYFENISNVSYYTTMFSKVICCRGVKMLLQGEGLGISSIFFYTKNIYNGRPDNSFILI